MTQTIPPDTGSRPRIRRRRTLLAVVVSLVAVSSLIGFLHGGGSDPHADGPLPAATARSAAASTPAGGATPSTPADGAAASAPAGAGAPVASPGQSATVPAAVPARGTGTFTTVTVPQTTSVGSGRTVTYALQIENGLGVDTAQVARTVGADLLDARGWQGVDHVRFVQLSAADLAKGAKPTAFITLASPKTVDKLCAPLDTEGEWSCGRNGRAVLNYERWALGVPYFNGDLTTYRAYMVNHEVGHLLGHQHQHCAQAGDYAPVMQQQSMGLQGCKAWPWPQRPAA